jgi:hypothetical protein
MHARLNQWFRRGALLPGFLLIPVFLDVGKGGPSSEEEVAPSSALIVGAEVTSSEVHPVELDLVVPVDPVRAEGGRVRAFVPRAAPFPAVAGGVEIHFSVQAVSVLAGDVLTLESVPEAVLLDV